MSSRRFALLSHILPPSPSGQSVMLYRILLGFAPENYYLVSQEEYIKKERNGDYLPAEYFSVPPPNVLRYIARLRIPYPIRVILTTLILLISRTAKLVKLIRNHPVQAIIACTGDVVDIPSAFIASKILGIDFYAYILDDYVFQWVGYYRSFAKTVSPWIFKRSTGLIGLNEYSCAEYTRRYHVDCLMIRNPCTTNELTAPINSEWPFHAGKIKVVYTGSIYHANTDCFHNLIAAMDALESYGVELHIYTSQTVEQLSDQGVLSAKVHVHPQVVDSEVFKVQRDADILFLPLAFNSLIPEVIRTSSPNKMGEYLACGRPVLAHVPDDSFVAYYFQKNHCGVIVGEPSVDLLCAHIKQIINDAELRQTVIYNARACSVRDFNPVELQNILRDFLGMK